MIRKQGKAIVYKDLIAFDGNGNGLRTFISHAHSDHLPSRKTKAIADSITIDVANTRVKRELLSPDNANGINYELLNAGHVLGAKMFYFDDNGKRVLYTGDFSLKEDILAGKAEIRKADILIIDGTYIQPDYIFPSQKSVVKELIDYLEDNKGKKYILAYSFGKAQTIAAWLDKYDVEYGCDIEVCNINNVLKQYGYKFKGKCVGDVRYESNDEDIVIIPYHKAKYINNAIKIGVSGWLSNPYYMRRMNIDAGFPISNHADHEDIIKFIKKVDPMYIVGFQTTEEFKEIVMQRLGIYAQVV